MSIPVAVLGTGRMGGPIVARWAELAAAGHGDDDVASVVEG
jgi:3-hydroxyisobutyrate dehydrogenase-like beta-hydroxyacid dehydrogenase